MSSIANTSLFLVVAGILLILLGLISVSILWCRIELWSWNASLKDLFFTVLFFSRSLHPFLVLNTSSILSMTQLYRHILSIWSLSSLWLDLWCKRTLFLCFFVFVVFFCFICLFYLFLPLCVQLVELWLFELLWHLWFF